MRGTDPAGPVVGAQPGGAVATDRQSAADRDRRTAEHRHRAAVDRIGPEHHELSGRAKDIGSAAVFVALLNAGVVWLLLLLT